jgi:hypothetical protein
MVISQTSYLAHQFLKQEIYPHLRQNLPIVYVSKARSYLPKTPNSILPLKLAKNHWEHLYGDEAFDLISDDYVDCAAEFENDKQILPSGENFFWRFWRFIHNTL